MRMLSLARSVALIGVLSLVAGMASAQVTVPMTGVWGNSRGPIIDFPAVGNKACPGLVMGQNLGLLTVPLITTPPIMSTGVPANPNGCVAGHAWTAMVTGSNPAAFSIPSYAFSFPFPAVPNIVPPGPASVIQVNTQISVMGPFPSPQIPLSPTMGIPNQTSPTNVANWRHFRASAWSTQSGRAGPDFTWCLGNPNCANIGGATPAPLITKYTAGPNKFGGTMTLLMGVPPGQSAGSIAVVQPAFPPGAIAKVALAGGFSFPEGRGYAVSSVASIPGGKLYAGYTLTSGGLLGMVTGTILTIPPGTNQAFGFPWTTGTVLVRNTGNTALGAPNLQTLTAMGSDARTAAGGTGNITLVAGGLTNTSFHQAVPNLGIMRLTFLPEPGTLLQLASGVVGLAGLGLVRRSRRANLG